MKWRNKQTGAVVSIMSKQAFPPSVCRGMNCEACPLQEDTEFLLMDDMDTPDCDRMYEEDPVRTMALLGWEPMEEANEMKEFTKADLKPGMVAELRNGDTCIVIPAADGDNVLAYIDFSKQILQGSTETGSMNNDLSGTDGDSDYDVMKVYGLTSAHGTMLDPRKPETYRTLIWKRPDVKEMTIEEVEALVGCKVKIVGGEKE